MFSPLIKEKFPFVSNYFETLIREDISRFPQSIVFEGFDTIGQYVFSNELARALNCLKDKNKDCDCINCSWVREGKHPAVNIVSPINFKDDSSKTVISIAQAKKVTKSLVETSDYHRVFIFTDAKIKKRTEIEERLIGEYVPAGYEIPEENWTPVPLTMKVFKAEASNSLLKSIEEPPARTTFIFLTKSKEDLISTIVSRSVVFKLINPNLRLSGGKISGITGNYPNLNIEEALNLAESVEKQLKTEEGDIFDFLNEFQEYILALMKQTGELGRFKRHIELVEKAKRRLQSSMSAKIVLESLFIDLVN